MKKKTFKNIYRNFAELYLLFFAKYIFNTQRIQIIRLYTTILKIDTYLHIKIKPLSAIG